MPFIRIEALKADNPPARTLLISTDHVSSLYSKGATGPNGGVMFGFVVLCMTNGQVFEFKYQTPDVAFPMYQMLERALIHGENVKI
ncbi:hypothetical protein [Hymenobacter baengnokdamensis]|uniref:hypothetical protein n=1 Tax=Hymenobacter baengnokdamensis TaxID=2615203 RepID=UPI0012450EAC|nr:hypothetical protein [Hymenobacter baengnokdamensis]